MAAKNVDKGTPLMNYCSAVLSHLRLGPEESGKGKGSSSSSNAGDKAAVPDPPVDDHLRSKLREILVIASFGDRFPPGVNTAPKIEGANILSEEPNYEKATVIRRELDAILDVTRKDASYRILGVCHDYPGMRRSKSYYLGRIKEHLLACSDAAILWYTGTSERNTGNWCFMDGIVTFQDIFELYMCHFRTRLLSIICDCSFSGRWAHELAMMLDICDVLACGHSAKMQGITIKVFSSCMATQEAAEMCFIKEAVRFDDKVRRIIIFPQKLSSGQTPTIEDFTRCRCGKTFKEACQINHAWKWMDKMKANNNLYWVKGFDKGKAAWHCVLLKEEKREEFIRKTQDEAGKHTLNLLEYGKILRSGWGVEPPKSVVEEIDKQYDM